MREKSEGSEQSYPKRDLATNSVTNAARFLVSPGNSHKTSYPVILNSFCFRRYLSKNLLTQLKNDTFQDTGNLKEL